MLTAGLGALVGVLRLLTSGRHTGSMLVPVFAAIVVSALTFAAVEHGIADPGLRTLIAPLVTFLPGGVLTTATIELASDEMVAGASRLVFGALQLILLTSGIVIGAALVGLPSAEVLRDNPGNLLDWWAPWLGVLLFGVAAAIYFSAPRGALPWLVAVLFTAWLGRQPPPRHERQRLPRRTHDDPGGHRRLPPAQRPPAQVTFLPAFWLLAPDAIGLISVTESIGNPTESGLENLVPPLASILAIALGVLCGLTVYHGRDAQARPRRARED